MKVNQLAKNVGVTSDTVRYYTRIGYLTPKKNSLNGYREYDESDQQRLRFILSARQLGFSVIDIGHILAEAGKGKSPCPMTRHLMEKRLNETERRFLETVALRKKMKAAVRAWKNKPDKVPTGKMICHLIEEFNYKPCEEPSR